MSVLETPRIFFKGAVAWDPIVTNNTPNFYDEAAADTVFSAATDKVKAFRAAAIAAVTTGGNWNPHGTHRSNFFDSAVCGFDLGDGPKTADPFVGAAARLTGMLVDLEPYGGLSSQIFFDSLHLGVDGGYRIFAPRSSRVTARCINFSRNRDNKMIAGVASVVWQTAFAKADGLRIDPCDSPALNALTAALNAEGVLGLTVRFNAYRTVYFGDPRLRNGSPLTKQAAQQLQAQLQHGGFQPNPAQSLLVGVLGLWRSGEPAHEPGDRVICPAGNGTLAAAPVRLDERTATLDLSNAVPEVDAELKKLDLGRLTLVAVEPADGSAITLATMDYAQYDRSAFEASAGIVVLPLAPGAAVAAASRDLQLRDTNGNVLLAESALRAVPSDPNLYLDEGQTHNARFQVYARGVPATTTIPITVYRMSADGGTVEQATPMTTDAQGLLSFPVPASSGGSISAYVPCVTGTDPAPSNGIDPQANTYMYVRTLPADPAVAAMAPTWSNVYLNVLSNWNAMAPCMDNWLRLDDETQVRAFATVLKRLTDPARFEDFKFMPVTRDMTAGARALLYRFLDSPSPTGLAAAKQSPDVERRKFVELSRSMRRA